MKKFLFALVLMMSTEAFSKEAQTVKELDEKRMIAGKFEVSTKKVTKKTHLEQLRKKLVGSKGFSRF